MKKKKNTLLWQISGEALKAPCYVFGTMHTNDSRAFARINTLEEKIDECEAFANEYDLGETDQIKLAQASVLPDGQTLEELLSPKQLKDLRKIFERETEQPLDLFMRSRPVIITNFLTEGQLGNEELMPLDSFLYDYAKIQQKNILGLESFDSQLEILSQISMDDQLSTLKFAIRNFKSFRKDIEKMVEVYAKADPLRILRQAKKSAGAMRQIMLYGRNEIMADRIAEIGSKQSLFAAIGAGHLAGKKGVLRLLKQKGLTVRPA